MRKIFFLLLIIFSEAAGSTYRVSSAADIHLLMKSVQPGDTIILSNGFWINQKIYFKAKGNEQKPIIIRAETPGRAIFTGQSKFFFTGEYITVDGLYFTDGYIIPDNPYDKIIEVGIKDTINGIWVTGNHLRLTNCAIDNFNPPDSSIHNFWAVLRGNNNRIDHCCFKNKRHFGNLMVIDANEGDFGNKVDSNYFGYRSPNIIGGVLVNGADIIMVGVAGSPYGNNNIIEYNYFEDCNGEDEIISNKSDDNIYHYNVFTRCAGFISLRWGKRAIVESNYFFGQHNISGGIIILSEDHKIYNNYFESLQQKPAIYLLSGDFTFPSSGSFPQPKNVQIVHNTFVNNQLNFDIGNPYLSDPSLIPQPPKDCIIANNVIYRSYLDEQNPFIITRIEPINLSWTKNIMFGSPIGMQPSTGIDSIDPKLQSSYPDFLWRLTSISPAINASVGSYPFITDDFDGQVRDNNKDVGCDEYSSFPIQRKSVDRMSTGPFWYWQPIPVELCSFIAEFNNGEVNINWQTSTEINNSGFYVEKKGNSPSTLIWNEIGFVKGKGTSTEKAYYFFNDKNITPGNYKYRLRQTDFNGTAFYSNELEVTISKEMSPNINLNENKLEQNYPNPFNPSTNIKFTIPALTSVLSPRERMSEGQVRVTLKVFDILGNEIATLLNEEKPAGNYEVEFSANVGGSNLSSGIYFYVLKAGETRLVRKMCLIK
ncbi:MAG: hypothetical protein NTX22_02040 [Ignavibacteriales bacterium]|nr:hypothetical protein [Ignavibacteriales bacterium]